LALFGVQTKTKKIELFFWLAGIDIDLLFCGILEFNKVFDFLRVYILQFKFLQTFSELLTKISSENE